MAFDVGSPFAKEEAPERSAPAPTTREQQRIAGGLMERTMRISDEEEEEEEEVRKNKETTPNHDPIPRLE